MRRFEVIEWVCWGRTVTVAGGQVSAESPDEWEIASSLWFFSENA